MTRAEPGASRTAARLTALGFEPVVAPVLVIRPLPQAAPDLTGIAALAFTSPNGVDAFAALDAARELPVFAVGEATAAAARAAGFGVVRSAGGDLSDLARLLAAEGPAAGVVLAPGAREPAGDLADLPTGGCEVRRLAVYEAIETGAVATPAFDAVLVHSPRAARAVAAMDAVRGRRVVVISVAAARPFGPRTGADLKVAEAPTEAALLEALGNPAPAV